MKPVWYVSRQVYYGVDPEDQNVVEIAYGGLDYSGADALVSKYHGEGEEYADPREAVKAAMYVALMWRADAPHKTISVAQGCTLGFTLPFEPQDTKELMEWAEERWNALQKCPTCGEVMEGATEWYRAGAWFRDDFQPFDDGDKYCSEHCAEKASTWDCDNYDCSNTYTYEEMRKSLTEVNGDALCPVCRLWPCAECGELHENCEGEDHDFEYTDFRDGTQPHELQCWDNLGETCDRYTVIWPNGDYLAMSAKPFHPQGFGQHGEGCKPLFPGELSELPRSEETGRLVSHLGHLICLDELPDDCIKLVFQDLVAELPLPYLNEHGN